MIMTLAKVHASQDGPAMSGSFRRFGLGGRDQVGLAGGGQGALASGQYATASSASSRPEFGSVPPPVRMPPSPSATQMNAAVTMASTTPARAAGRGR